MTDPTTPVPEYRSVAVICLCTVLLLAGVGLAGATPSDTDPSISYDGSVAQQDGAVYLWYLAPFRASVTLPDVATGTTVCLSQKPTYTNENQRIGCTLAQVDSGSATATFETERWPAPTTGRYTLVVTVGARNDTDARRVHSEQVVVVRRGGDIDGDGLANVVERRGVTNFTNADTDGDGLRDGPELKEYGTDPTSVDTDRDGLRDGIEVFLGTDPVAASDGVNASTIGGALGEVGEPEPKDARDGSAHSRADLVPSEWWPTAAPADSPARGTLVLAGVGLLAIVSLLGARRALGGWRGILGAGTQAEPGTVDGARETVTPISSDEAYVLRLVHRHAGRLEQAEIVEASGWSKAKVSRLLSRLAEYDRIEKEQVGRRNVIVLPKDE